MKIPLIEIQLLKNYFRTRSIFKTIIFRIYLKIQLILVVKDLIFFQRPRAMPKN